MMDFNFDCPKSFLDINSLIGNPSCVVNDVWFEIYHPEHDHEYTYQQNTEIYTNDMKPISSIKATSKYKRKDNIRDENNNVIRLNKQSGSATEGLEKEIKLFNSKRQGKGMPITVNRPLKINEKKKCNYDAHKSIDKNPNELNVVPTESSNVDLDDLEREIQLINTLKSNLKLPTSSKSFGVQVTVIKPQCHLSESAQNDCIFPAQSTMQSKLKEYKFKKFEMDSQRQKIILNTNKKSSIVAMNVNLAKPTAPLMKPEVALSEIDLALKLKKHNEQFANKKSAAYEPSRHSVREVRAWERASGKMWASLSTEERQLANSEILAVKEQVL
jgi:hypothetical protein